MPSYLTAGKIKEGMSGTISGEPREEKHDFQDGKGEKLLFRIPITLDQAIRDDYANEDVKDWIWSPGVFAVAYLEEQLGTSNQYQSWINTHGSFHPKAWKSKNKSGFAWHFLPDPQGTLDLQQKAESLVPPVEEPDTLASAYTREAAKEKKLYECAYCNEQGDQWSTYLESNFLSHVKKFHPEKVPKDETQVPNMRVKKK